MEGKQGRKGTRGRTVGDEGLMEGRTESRDGRRVMESKGNLAHIINMLTRYCSQWLD